MIHFLFFHSTILFQRLTRFAFVPCSFIHGGAWRDPTHTVLDFEPSVRQLVSHSQSSSIRGFASIDYRLSTGSQATQGSSGVSSSESARVVHPDHILDVRSALQFLATEYQLANDYVLIGHSAGATLAFQLLMGQEALQNRPLLPAPLPAAVIGISGIYDLVGINDRFDGQYAEFISGAFGSDKSAWTTASPACFKGNFKDNWSDQAAVVLATSTEDTLIDEPEIETMAAKLTKDGIQFSIHKDLTGEHNFIWEDGTQVVRLVAETLTRLQQAAH